MTTIFRSERTASRLAGTPRTALGFGLIFLAACSQQDTPSIAEERVSTGALSIRKTGPGDGSVLRSSALLDERAGSMRRGMLQSPIAWSGVQFLFSDHLGLTEDPAFADNVLFLLLEQPRLSLRVE